MYGLLGGVDSVYFLNYTSDMSIAEMSPISKYVYQCISYVMIQIGQQPDLIAG